MKKRFLIVVTLLILVLSACGQKQLKDGKNWPIEDEFSYTDQNGGTFGLKDLKGKVWVADFIFTNCEDVCLPMTSNMAKLQKMAKDEGIENIEFVSFSVDPTVDKPEVLKEYGAKFNADYSNWHFLTGYQQEEIEKLALENFKALVKKPQKGDQVIHGTDFYLIDKEGKIQKYYTGLNDTPFAQIISDIKVLE